MSRPLGDIESVLRGRAPLGEGGLRGAWLLAWVVALGGVYGAAMGSFPGTWGGGFESVRVLQMLNSGVKVPLLLLVTFAIALPSFYAVNVLMGVGDDFRAVLRALAATQTAVVAVLASLAPFTLLWYAGSVADGAGYSRAIAFNAALFAVASVSGQFVLGKYYRPLIARNRNHRKLMFAWVLIYGFVGVQMAWVLRPFVGNPGKATTFFREGAWGNAYVELLQIVWRALGG